MAGKSSRTGTSSSPGLPYRCLAADRGLAVVDADHRGFFLPDSESWDDGFLDQPEIAIQLSDEEIRELCDPARPVALTHFGPWPQDKVSNQDFALSARIGGAASSWGFAAVADGVSLKTFWPERASRIASLVAYKFFREKIQAGRLEVEEPSPTFLKSLATELSQHLEQALKEDRGQLEQAGNVPSTFTPEVFQEKIEDLKLWYNTTLLVALFGPRQGLVLYAGDGGVVLVKKRGGSIDPVFTQRTAPGVELDRYVSLKMGDSEFQGRWIRTVDCERAAIFLSSDGLDRTLQQNDMSYEELLPVKAYDDPRGAWSRLREQHQGYCFSDRPAKVIEPDNSSLALVCWPPWPGAEVPASLPEFRRIGAKKTSARSDGSQIHQDLGPTQDNETEAARVEVQSPESPSQPVVDPDDDFQSEGTLPSILSYGSLVDVVPSVAQDAENMDTTGRVETPAVSPVQTITAEPAAAPRPAINSDDDFQPEEPLQTKASSELVSRANRPPNDSSQPGDGTRRVEAPESSTSHLPSRHSGKVFLVLLAVVGLAILASGWWQGGQNLPTGHRIADGGEPQGEHPSTGNSGPSADLTPEYHPGGAPPRSKTGLELPTLSIVLADNPDFEAAISHEGGAAMNPALFEELLRWADWLHAVDPSEGSEFTVVAYSDRAPEWEREGRDYCEEVLRLSQRGAQRFAELLESVARDFQIYAEQNICALPESIDHATLVQARRFVLFHGRPGFNCTCTVEGFPPLQPWLGQDVVARFEMAYRVGDASSRSS